MTLTLIVDHQVTGPHGRGTDEVADLVQQVAENVDEIRVDRTGVGFVLADTLLRRGVDIVAFNPAAVDHSRADAIDVFDAWSSGIIQQADDPSNNDGPPNLSVSIARWMQRIIHAVPSEEL